MRRDPPASSCQVIFGSPLLAQQTRLDLGPLKDERPLLFVCMRACLFQVFQDKIKMVLKSAFLIQSTFLENDKYLLIQLLEHVVRWKTKVITLRFPVH